jgi:hypothetical protein
MFGAMTFNVADLMCHKTPSASLPQSGHCLSSFSSASLHSSRPYKGPTTEAKGFCHGLPQSPGQRLMHWGNLDKSAFIPFGVFAFVLN